MAQYFFKQGLIVISLLFGLYACLLGLLTTSSFQAHVVYLHKIQMTWFKDLNVPEVFGFLPNQVTPFNILSSSGNALYAWHILPVELYRQHEIILRAESPGFISDITLRFAFRLLRNDPDARLIIHFHGAAGTVGSGYRVPNYRALSAGDPEKVHVLAFDYRGFGRSYGIPSESGLIQDSIAVVEWVMNIAGIPPSCILFFGQSLGTAVTLAVSEHFALQAPPVVFAGAILVAPFVDVATLVATYCVAGLIPILSPLARFPWLFNYFSTFIQDKWLSGQRIASYVQSNEVNDQKYRLTIIHAEDDWDIPWYHTELLFWHAVNATLPSGMSYDVLEKEKSFCKTDLGASGSVTALQVGIGVFRKEILKTGLHDVIMGNPVITMAVMRIFEANEEPCKVRIEVTSSVV